MSTIILPKPKERINPKIHIKFGTKLNSFFLIQSFLIQNLKLRKVPEIMFSFKNHRYFDPLNILKGKSESRVKFTRESELQHGRAAMLATVTIPFLEYMDSENSMLGINYLSSLDAYHQAPFWLGVSAYEFIRMGRGWENPFTSNTTFSNDVEITDNLQVDNLNIDGNTISATNTDGDINIIPIIIHVKINISRNSLESSPVLSPTRSSVVTPGGCGGQVFTGWIYSVRLV